MKASEHPSEAPGAVVGSMALERTFLVDVDADGVCAGLYLLDGRFGVSGGYRVGPGGWSTTNSRTPGSPEAPTTSTRSTAGGRSGMPTTWGSTKPRSRPPVRQAAEPAATAWSARASIVDAPSLAGDDWMVLRTRLCGICGSGAVMGHGGHIPVRTVGLHPLVAPTRRNAVSPCERPIRGVRTSPARPCVGDGGEKAPRGGRT